GARQHLRLKEKNVGSKVLRENFGSFGEDSLDAGGPDRMGGRSDGAGDYGRQARIFVRERALGDSGDGHFPSLWQLRGIFSAVRSEADVDGCGGAGRWAGTVVAGAQGGLRRSFSAELSA